MIIIILAELLIYSVRVINYGAHIWYVADLLTPSLAMLVVESEWRNRVNIVMIEAFLSKISISILI